MKVNLSIVVCIFISTSVFTTFPITENNNLISVAAELPFSGVDYIAKTSIILTAIAVFLNVILIISSSLV